MGSVRKNQVVKVMNNSVSNDNNDSQASLNQIVIEFMREQKRNRRWRLIWRFVVMLVILFGFIYLFIVSDEEKIQRSKPHTGLIDVTGGIFDSQNASAENFVKSVENAYGNSGLKALIIRINSPGGSPVQADYMYNTVRYLRTKYPDIKIYAVCVDMCASAAYYLASAADEIYANPSSMIGSIGVLYNGFGFVDALQKLGVTRRVQTAGVNKAFLDPFSPISPEQSKILQSMLDDIHHVFIERVKEGRGSRLKIDDLTFSGLFWTGNQAKERGLIDGFASSVEITRDLVHVEQVIDYTYKQNLFERFAKNIGTAIADQLPVALGLKSEIKA